VYTVIMTKYNAVRLLFGACLAAVLSACNSGTAPQVNSSASTPEAMRDFALKQAESQLKLDFNVLERQDTISGQTLWVYHDTVIGKANPTYLTISLKGNAIGWSANHMNNETATMETFKMEIPAGLSGASVKAEDLKLNRTTKKFIDIVVPESLKTYWNLDLKKSSLAAQSCYTEVCTPPGTPYCKRCVTSVTVAGHYESSFVTNFVSGASSTAAGAACSPGGIWAAAGCGGLVYAVVTQVLTWVPGYSYCTEWTTLTGPCPVSFVEDFDKIYAFSGHDTHEAARL
jgi:hypothetical protein